MARQLTSILILATILLGAFAVPSPADSQEPDPILDVAWSPDGDLIASAFGSGTVEVTDAGSGQLVFSFASQQSGDGAAIAWNPSESDQFAAGIGNTVYVWDITADETLFKLLAGNASGIAELEIGTFPEDINSLAWMADGSKLASLSLDGILRVWGMSSGAMTLDIDTYQMYSLDWSSDGTQLFAGAGVAMRVINATTGAIENLQDGQRVNGMIPFIDLSPDGTALAASTIAGDIMIWDVASGQIEHRISPPGTDPNFQYVQWSPDSSQLASAGLDGTIRVWDRSGNELAVIQVEDRVYSVDWSPDGARLVYGGQSGILQIVELAPADVSPAADE